MSNEIPKESNVKSTIEAVTGLVKAVPIYEDALQPAAKQIGNSLETVTKVINIALLPLRGVIWGYEKIEDWLSTVVANKLKSVPEDKIITPPLIVAGPTIDGLRYAAEEEEIRELYANLLATAMNKDTVHKAHPGYVNIIKNITSDEVLILKVFLEKQMQPSMDLMARAADGIRTLIARHHTHLDKKQPILRPDLVPSYLDNLCRLGLLEIPDGIWMAQLDNYTELEKDTSLEEMRSTLKLINRTLVLDKKLIRTSCYGDQFIEHVIKME